MAGVCTQGLDTGFVELGYAKVALLGVVQGITELLPISSTAHMRIVPAFLGWRDPGSAFFGGDAARRARGGGELFLERRANAVLRLDRRHPPPRLPRLEFALFDLDRARHHPDRVFGVLLSPILNACGTPLRGLMVIGCASLFMAALLACPNSTPSTPRSMEDVTLKDALLVGLRPKAGALIPGVSRSGSTLTAALFLNMNREEAARFSFLLGVPGNHARRLEGALRIAEGAAFPRTAGRSCWSGSWSLRCRPSSRSGA